MRSSENQALEDAEESTSSFYEDVEEYNAKKEAEAKLEAHAKKMAARYFLRAQLKGLYVDVDGAANMYENGALDGADWWHTIFRIYSVAAAVVANGINNADPDPSNPSDYDQRINFGTVAAYAIGILTLIPAAIGAYLIYKKIKDDRTVNTTTYQLEQIRNVNPGTTMFDDTDILEQMNEFLARGKVTVKAEQWKATKKKPALPTLPKIGDVPDTYDSETIPESESEVESEPDFAGALDELQYLFLLNVKNTKKALTPIAKTVKEKTAKYFEKTVKAALVVYDKLRILAFNFWPIWFFSVLIVGITATVAAPALPGVIAATLIFSAIYIGVTAYLRRGKANHDAIQKTYISDELSENLNDARAELRQRIHMKEAHRHFNRIFNPNKPKKQYATVEPEYVVTATQKDRVIYLTKNPLTDRTQPERKALVSAVEGELIAERTAKKKEALLRSKVYKKLVGSKKTNAVRIGLNAIFRFLNQYALASFVLWFLGSMASAISFCVLAPAAAIFATIAGGLLSGIATFVMGTTAGIVAHFPSIKNAKSKRTKEIEAIQARLLEPYTGNVTIKHNPDPTKLEVHEYFSSAIAAKKRKLAGRLASYQKLLHSRMKNEHYAQQKFTPREFAMLDINLNDYGSIDPHYLVTQRKKTIGDISNTVLRYAYRMIGAIMTNTFYWRSTLLVGGFFVMFTVAPIPAIVFLSIVIATGIAMAIAKGVQMYLNDKAEENKLFLKKLDGIISGEKKHYKELNDIERYLNAHLTEAKPKAKPDQEGIHLTAKKVAAELKSKAKVAEKAVSERVVATARVERKPDTQVAATAAAKPVAAVTAATSKPAPKKKKKATVSKGGMFTPDVVAEALKGAMENNAAAAKATAPAPAAVGMVNA